MAGDRSFLEQPEGTREEIMQATYRALCEHGYAALTIQRIAENFGKSKSLLYHHYDGKDELLLDFLSFMLEEFRDAIPDDVEDDPADHLDEVLDRALATDRPTEYAEFEAAMVELRAQAAHDERYRAHFTRHDRFFEDRLTAVVDAGVADGSFRDVDPDRVATFLLTLLEGARGLRATSDVADVEGVRDEIDAYLDARLRD